MSITWNTVWMTVTGLAAACFLTPFVWRLMKWVGKLVFRYREPLGSGLLAVCGLALVLWAAIGWFAVHENKDLRAKIELLEEDKEHALSIIREMQMMLDKMHSINAEINEQTNEEVEKTTTNTFVGDGSTLEYVDTGNTIADWTYGGEVSIGQILVTTPAHFITFGDDLITIDTRTGKVTVDEDLSMDDVSKEFWSGLSQAFPRMFVVKEVSE